MGYRHDGRGFCTYEGGYMENYFHGEGTFTCIDGRCYKGGWMALQECYTGVIKVQRWRHKCAIRVA